MKPPKVCGLTLESKYCLFLLGGKERGRGRKAALALTQKRMKVVTAAAAVKRRRWWRRRENAGSYIIM